ncbi:hypothetical protein BIW11_03982 [Tropilaelaps mercedesae]|uniref:Uncharacterized protein n=1 Tax=Tropilaelaps mercedesae TaxID=418985 RepID=A0A1V9XD93_9ACAR|nr:hypothetical protein BIW11_03982 [Tropilaelaps mercedesae]
MTYYAGPHPTSVRQRSVIKHSQVLYPQHLVDSAKAFRGSLAMMQGDACPSEIFFGRSTNFDFFAVRG